jgi:uncharacterized membrane protein
MFKKIEDYLNQLKTELKGSDPALIQDALSDAEEFFRNALFETGKSSPHLSEEEVLSPLIAKYGTPSEIASAYKDIESRVLPALATRKTQASRSFWAKFFGVAIDARTWGSFVYILISGITAFIFGLWTLLGGAISLVSLVLIIGLPVTGLFLLSIRGIALMEGRMIEALLGVRMPRKTIFLQKGLGWKEKLKTLITESYTWRALAYLILHFPLGLVYFTITFLMFALSIKCTIYPVWYGVLDRPLITLGQPLYPPVWSFPLIIVFGIVLFFSSLHFAKLTGKAHGRFAKSMLIRKQ